MGDELLEVFAWLFDTSREQHELLNPVRRLEEVVDLEAESHVTMRVIDPKVLCVKD